MKKIILFSTPTETNISKLFPMDIDNKRLAYMPSNGRETKQEYTDFWKEIANKNQTEFIFIDNSLPTDSDECKKLQTCNILLITGGNTFALLNNLRNSGLDKAIKEFVLKPEFVISGFSAGAIVLSPTIQICNLPNFDENLVGITDLNGLKIINFEVFPHYDPTKHQKILEDYRKTTNNSVREITNEDFIEIVL